MKTKNNCMPENRNLTTETYQQMCVHLVIVCVKKGILHSVSIKVKLKFSLKHFSFSGIQFFVWRLYKPDGNVLNVKTSQHQYKNADTLYKRNEFLDVCTIVQFIVFLFIVLCKLLVTLNAFNSCIC